MPLGVVVSAANCHDMKQAEAILDSLVVPRPAPTPAQPQHLCRDKGFDYPATRQAAEARGYCVHTPHRGEGAAPPVATSPHPARRWVIERTHSWHNGFRKLRIRHEKKAANYRALLQFACCLLTFQARLRLASVLG
jgi:transposase